MKTIKLPSGNTATLPEGWHEVTVQQSLDIDYYDAKKYHEVYEFGLDEWGKMAMRRGYAISCICPEYNTGYLIKQMPQPDFNVLLNEAAWLNDPPLPAEMGDRIQLGDGLFKVCTQFNSLTTIQWMYMQKLHEQTQGKIENTEIAMNFAACMIRPIDCKEWTHDVMLSNLEALKLATVSELAGIADFFLRTQIMRLSATLPSTSRMALLAILARRVYSRPLAGATRLPNWLKHSAGHLTTLGSRVLTRFLRYSVFGPSRQRSSESRTKQ
jgi:hypothetical protein